MKDVETTRMSSRGQIVIPEAVRTRLGLKAGTKFLVVGEKDVVILKAIAPPSMAEFGALVAEARKQARKAGVKHSDVAGAIRKARSGR